MDRPIGLRLDPPIAYVCRSPVAVKRHDFMESDHWNYLIQIVRDPRDAIVSHTKEMAFDAFSEKLSVEVEAWLEHIDRFEKWDPSKRINIRYSDVTNRADWVLSQLEDFLRLARIDSVESVEAAAAGRSALIRPAASTPSSPAVLFPERARMVEEKLNTVRPLEDLESLF